MLLSSFQILRSAGIAGKHDWKALPVLLLQVDPFCYQIYKSFTCCITSFLILTYTPFRFTYWGIVGGLIWVCALAPAVRHPAVSSHAALPSLVAGRHHKIPGCCDDRWSMASAQSWLFREWVSA